ncbi:hypothetical protein DFA_06309 [Cavenderia fasciculata]|uniref:Uncharacterized protein n=1 Tax=Cavenderia fasciculata TaxID=261658 RepID=F4PKN9_CACFS|nr:uncharacterized protein DFA_06309 [Cavenderia fasciculata]EGG24163.1 hypothetical protein DFA_06309 [Cavenderia fasciculata]|eukprot:XP_004362014.1 hypothetical protein DFA_06309 [Cavenderia fasciculata]
MLFFKAYLIYANARGVGALNLQHYMHWCRQCSMHATSSNARQDEEIDDQSTLPSRGKQMALLPYTTCVDDQYSHHHHQHHHHHDFYISKYYNGVRWQGKDSKLCDGCKLTDYNCQCSKAQLADKENDSTLKVSQLADDMNETLKVFISLENTSPSPTMLLESLFSLSKKTVKELIEFCNLNSIKYYQQEEPTKGKNKRGSHKDSKGGATNSKKDQLINAIIKFNFEKQKRDASKNKKKRSKSSSTTNDRCKDQDQSNSQKDGNKSTSNSVSTHDYGFGKSLCDSQIKDLWKSKNPNATEMPFKTKWQWLYCPVCDHFFNRDSSAAKNILLLGILHQTADYRPWIYRPLPADIVHIGRVDTT